METIYVHDIYNKIAKEFDVTRFSLWYGVTAFLDKIIPNSTILDLGCGNGKYLSYRKDCHIYGCDTSTELLNIAKIKHPHANLCIANGIDLPYSDNFFDSIISIAVLHHIDSYEKRIKFIQEINRVVKPGGSVFISVWAEEAPIKNKNKWKIIDKENHDYLVPWHSKEEVYYRYYHLFTYDEIKNIIDKTVNYSYLDIKFDFDNWYVEYKKL